MDKKHYLLIGMAIMGIIFFWLKSKRKSPIFVEAVESIKERWLRSRLKYKQKVKKLDDDFEKEVKELDNIKDSKKRPFLGDSPQN